MLPEVLDPAMRSLNFPMAGLSVHLQNSKSRTENDINKNWLMSEARINYLEVLSSNVSFFDDN